MKKGKVCIVIGIVFLMCICGASGLLAQQGLVADPPEMEFGVVTIGDSVTDPVTVTNYGFIVQIIEIYIEGNWAGDFSLVDPPTLPFPLEPGESMTIWVQFAPSNKSFQQWELNVVPNVGDPLIIILMGAGDDPVGCIPPLVDCYGVCIDTNTDPDNCGDCGNACPTPENGLAVCEAGECGISCDDGFTDCDGVCLDTSSDKLNCGGCGIVCIDPPGGTSYCQDGGCVVDCGDLTPCGGTCVDTDSDVNNCGACDNPCVAPDNGTAICSSGTCDFDCDLGYEPSGDSCVPIVADVRDLLEELIAFYDTSIGEGNLEGTGINWMWKTLYVLFERMNLTFALLQYDLGNFDRTCFRLDRALSRADGDSDIRDFVEGPALEELQDRILEITALLGCNL